MDPRRRFGDEGESLAAAHLKKKGYRLVETQYRVPSGEIDLVALDGDEVVFVEVKTRRGRAFGYPEESVTPEKIRRLLRAADAFLRERAWEGRHYRVDVVSVLVNPSGAPEVVHFPAIDMPEGLW